MCRRNHVGPAGQPGERITPLQVPKLHIVLANPGKPLPTADVFRRFSGVFSSPIKMPKMDSPSDLLAFLRAARNDLETAAIELMPAIGELLAALRATKKCQLARMSGSGATCFGLYESGDNAKAASLALQQKGFWSVATEMAHG